MAQLPAGTHRPRGLGRRALRDVRPGGLNGRYIPSMLVSERIGQFFVESDGGRDRLEYTEYGSGDQWVVLLHGLLMPRRMQQPLARAMAAQGLHVVTLDLLGHGRSDQPADPLVYSMTAFGEQVVALLDHLGAEQAVIGGTSLGANVSLEVAVIAPERVKGLIVEMPVLNNALVAGILAFVPVMLAARYLPFTANSLQKLARSVPRGVVPFWAGIGLDTVDHRADSIAAVLHGVIFGRIAPSSRLRRQIQAPALVVGHPIDPIHPFVDADMLAAELSHVRIERASSILEWRFRPERLTAAATDFAQDCWHDTPAPRAARSRKR
ncbi:alpha/beta hydrolase [Nocardioides sp. Root122]|nr:alpha/beta hydrolase [Nocardioides sp. Root122]